MGVVYYLSKNLDVGKVWSVVVESIMAKAVLWGLADNAGPR